MDEAAAAGSAGGVIQRAQEARLAFEQLHHFLLVPEMIAAGDDVDARREDFRRRGRGDTGAAGGVFAVGNGDIHTLRLPQMGNQLLNRAPPGLPHDVPNEKQFHRARLTWRRLRASRFPPVFAGAKIKWHSRERMPPGPRLNGARASFASGKTASPQRCCRS